MIAPAPFGRGGHLPARILPPDPPRSLGAIETRWSVVRGLEPSADPQRFEAAWRAISETYRPAMEAFVVRLLRRARGSSDGDEAADVVQGFLARCAEKGWLVRADPARGSFRAFVRVALRRWLRDRLDAERALKRRPATGAPVLLGDGAEALPGPDEDDPAAAEALDQGWVRAAVDRALDRLRRGNARYHEVLLDLIAHDGEPSPDLPSRLGVEPRHADVLRYRARRRFARLFAEEMRATVADERDLADEWRSLARWLP